MTQLRVVHIFCFVRNLLIWVRLWGMKSNVAKKTTVERVAELAMKWAGGIWRTMGPRAAGMILRSDS